MAQMPSERYKTPSSGGAVSTPFVGAGVPDGLAKWEVEMCNLGREIIGKIDTKLAVLQTFTENAERAAIQLETLIDRYEQISSKTGHVDSKSNYFANYPHSNTENLETRESRLNELPELPNLGGHSALFSSRLQFSDDSSDFSLSELPDREHSKRRIPNPEKTIPFPKKEKTLLSEEALKAEFDFEKPKSTAPEKIDDHAPRLISFPKASPKEVRSIVENPAKQQSKNEFSSGPRPQFSSLMDNLAANSKAQTVPQAQTQPKPQQPQPPTRPEILDPEPQPPVFPDLVKAEFAQAAPESEIDENEVTKIRMLANYGYSAKDIAYQLNLPELEVERHLRHRVTLASG